MFINKSYKKFIKFFKLFIISSIICLTVVTCANAAFKAPKPYNFVNDYANIIGEANEAKLNSIILELKSKTGAEIAVVTLNSLEGYPIEDVALEIGRQWGVGDKRKNNGLVLLVAPNERKLRIEVGYGLEGAISDSRAGRIRDESMLPQFRAGNYEAGIINSVLQLSDLIAREYNITIDNQNLAVSQPQIDTSNIFGELGYLLFVLLFCLLRFTHRRTSSYTGFGGGSFGRGSSFGGFGGGGFGGGGASGGW